MIFIDFFIINKQLKLKVFYKIITIKYVFYIFYIFFRIFLAKMNFIYFL